MSRHFAGLCVLSLMTTELVWQIHLVRAEVIEGSSSASGTAVGEPRLNATGDATVCTAVTHTVARPPAKQIRAALREPTTIEFVQTPLTDVVDYLKDLHRIEIQCDKKALEGASIGEDAPVTTNLKGVGLARALRHILDQLDLIALEDEQILMITTPAAADRKIAVRIYDCDWAPSEKMPALVEVVRLVADDTAATTPVVSTQAATTAAAPGPPQTEGRKPIATVAQPSTGFRAVAYGSCLVIRTSVLKHDAVARLLDEVRQHEARGSDLPGKAKDSPSP